MTGPALTRPVWCGAWLMMAPAGLVRRMAAGTPTEQDVRGLHILAGASETDAAQALQAGQPAPPFHHRSGPLGASFVAGIVLAIAGGSMVHAADAGGWPTSPAHGWGMPLLVTGILLILAAAGTAAGLIIKDIATFTAEQNRRYKA